MVTVEHPDLSLPKGICQPGCTRLQDYLMHLFILGNSGCYNPNSRLTSGAPSFHVPGQAIDLTANYNDAAPNGQRDRGNAVFNWYYDHREELNLQQIIFGNRIWSSFDQEIKLYAHSDHYGHCHASIGREAALNWEPPTEHHVPFIPPTMVYNFEDCEEDMRQARSVAYPTLTQINTFAVDRPGILRQLWWDGEGTEHKVNISAQLPGVGLFDVESPITFATLANGDLIVNVYGQDGTANAVRYIKASNKWVITTIGGF